MTEKPLVTVGIPTYNRARGLEHTLQSIGLQSYSNLEIVVSDNASPDKKVGEIISQAARIDKRIKHFTQPANIGASENFLFVLRQASGSFFMWAADDDQWHPTFIEKLLHPLLSNPCCGLSFCDFNVCYSDGSPCEDYGSFSEAFSHFTHGGAPQRVIHYALQAPERGKANIVYSLFRMDALDYSSAERFFHSKAWGGDMLFVCDILSRWSFSLADDKLYTVGISSPQIDQHLPHAEYAGQNRGSTAKLRLAAGHLRYGFAYIQILAKTRGSNPIIMLRFIIRLIPLLWAFVKTDLL